METPVIDSLVVACPDCLSPNRVDATRVGEAPRCGRCATPLLDGSVAELDERSFDAFAARTSMPLVVDFWAPWCGPCRQMAPAFEEASRRLAGRVRFAKVDTDLSPALAARLGIRAVPTLVLLKAGEELRRTSGAQSVGELARFAESA